MPVSLGEEDTSVLHRHTDYSRRRSRRLPKERTIEGGAHVLLEEVADLPCAEDQTAYAMASGPWPRPDRNSPDSTPERAASRKTP